MRAHLDLQGGAPAGIMLPIHWGTFNLALHPWEEPAEGTVAAARQAGAPLAVPRPGEPFEPAAAHVHVVEPGERRCSRNGVPIEWQT